MHIKKIIILVFIFIAFSQSAFASVRYLSLSGQDKADCSDGTSTSPWRSLAMQYNNGCIIAGDTVYFLEGTYSPLTDPDIFFNSTGNIGRLTMTGLPGLEITIAADPFSATPWPTKFLGEFVISAEYLIIDGIEFIREVENRNIVSVGKGHHVTIQNSAIHGDEDDFVFGGMNTGAGDCLKIAGGSDLVEFISIVNSQIYNCNEDAVDVTGRKNIELIGNEIYEARQIQVKGGVNTILFDNNVIHHMRNGIIGGGMNCTSGLQAYCGDPAQPLLPVQDRFQATNVTIQNNFIHDIAVAEAIQPSGWQQVIIRDNNIQDGTLSPGGSAIQFKDNAPVSAFFDSIAEAYCSVSRLPEDCLPCSTPGGTPCWKIRLRADNVQIFNNTFTGSERGVLNLVFNAVETVENICFTNNSYSFSNGSELFYIFSTPGQQYVGSPYTNETSLPLCGLFDADGDGLSDQLEILIGTDPFMSDSDGDTLSDFDEVNIDGDPTSYIIGSDLDPLQPDTDGDGVNDGLEVEAGTDPLLNTSFPVLNNGDVNNDGLVNTADLILATRILLGQLSATPLQNAKLDVAPLVAGVPAPDGNITAGDYAVLIQKVMGIVSF